MKYFNVSVKKSEYHKVIQWCHDTFGDCNGSGNGKYEVYDFGSDSKNVIVQITPYTEEAKLLVMLKWT
jgi:hypothetical protein